MAQKRMFSLKVIDTDLFIEMPQSTRLLYYELCMRADDDGFVASPNKIRKIAGCSEDDYKILMAKQYIIPFESGVCVIKHWRIHNLIRADRYNETEYRLEKSTLIDNNGKYELGTQNVIPPVIPIGNQMHAQVRVGKVRVGKVIKEPVKKNVYGEFKKVLLTDDEYKRLLDKYGKLVTDKAIVFLDLHIEEKSYISKSHVAAIQKWVVNAVMKQNSPFSKQQEERKELPEY